LVGHGGGGGSPPPQSFTLMNTENEEQEEESILTKKPETFSFKSISFKNAFWIVLLLHMVAIFAIMFFGGSKKAIAKEDEKVLQEPIPEYVGVDYSSPTPTPTPEPTPTPTPLPKAVTIYPKETNPNYPQYTKEYVVKQGDTFYSIVKRYGLKADKLIKLNNIKDPNKIQIGQKLKFM
jgi:LysM repeat protein